jgi:hypothetical protein
MRKSDKGVYRRITEADVGTWNVVCGDCGLEIRTKETHNRRALQKAREAGWEHAGEPGWLCPACLARSRE